MSKYVRLFFNRKKKATTTVAGAIEIVVCLQRERCYFHSGHNVTLDQWENGMVVNHPRAVVINEEIQKKVTEFEHWKSHATLTLLATQDCPLWLQYD